MDRGERALVIFPGALGDLCLLAPAVATLAATGLTVELSIRRVLEPVASVLLPGVALGPSFDGAAMASLFGDEIAPDVRRWLEGATRIDAWLASAAGDGRLRARLAASGRATTRLHAVPRSDGTRHVSEEYALALAVTASERHLAVRAPAPRPGPWRKDVALRLLVHPGAGAAAKRWSADGFRRIVDAWIAAGGDAAVLLGPAEEDAVEWWRASALPIMSDVSLADASGVIVSAPRWIGNDSGMSHLAGLLGRRGVALFGPTNPRRWRPLGGALTALEFSGRDEGTIASEALRLLRGPLA